MIESNIGKVREVLHTADRSALATYRTEAEADRKAFLELFPRERWAAMSITDYALGQDENEENLCRWLEYKTRKLGGVSGYSSKYSIFYHKQDKSWRFRKSEYSDEHQAWDALRSGFLEAFKKADAGEFEAIDQIPALNYTPMVRAKVMQMYYPEEILPIYSINHIRHFLRLLGHESAEDKSYDVIRLNRVLLKALRDLPETKDLSNLEIMRALYNKISPRKEIDDDDVGFELTPDQLNRLLNRLRKELPDFADFDDPGEAFQKHETRYKRKALDRYQKEMGNKKARELVSKGESVKVIKHFGKITGNLVQFFSWRQSFGETNDTTAPILSAILDVAEKPYLRASDLKPVFDAAASLNRKLDWDALSTSLWLMRPEDYFPVKISYYRKLAKELGWDMPKGRAGVNNFARVHAFGRVFRDALAPLKPQDWVDVQSFIWVVCPETYNKDKSGDPPEIQTPTGGDMKTTAVKQPLNCILYGPPGTGKTYSTFSEAVRIIDGTVPDTPASIKARFDELIDQSRIAFVTFHQSFSYEDFVEGIRPEMSDSQGASVPRYTVRNGLFKDMCAAAAAKSKIAPLSHVNLDGIRFWKMSLGNTLDPEEAGVFDDCIQHNQIAHGYGRDKDFSTCASKDAIAEILKKEVWLPNERPAYHITSIDMLKNQMREGDLVVVSDGNRKFRAIGRVSGPYSYKADGYYTQTRPVEWLRVFEESLPSERILKDRQFSQQTLYSIDPEALRRDALQDILATGGETAQGNFVLIIDEINRGNISKIFGELITLIEDDKRLGSENEIKVKLPYSGSRFGVPSNLYILGTMNTADKSIALVDVALRRRFTFIELMPDYSILQQPYADILREMNKRICLRKDRDHQIGHSYLMKVVDDEQFNQVFADKIIPLLQEYFVNDWEGMRFVLGESEENQAGFIRKLEGSESKQARVKFTWYSDIGDVGSLDAVEELVSNYNLSNTE
ncbi:MAG: AAA family ATPase [Kiritimatiellae bacterium]|jgi:hypothetical protein|nr:AAA family ATPase [Kiritimatiellia bacterium]MDY0148508.1 AAA family ATPase [Kiritimatiellia bacterium]